MNRSLNDEVKDSMGHILTNRYALSAEKTRARNPVTFLLDVIRHGKSRELISFIIWELMHRLGLFPKEKYLKFEPDRLETSGNVRINDLDVSEEIIHTCHSIGLNISEISHNWKVLFIKDNGELLGCLYPDDSDLYKSVDKGKSISHIYHFPRRIKSLFVTSQDTIFVCIEGAIYRSTDNDSSFKKVVELGSSVSFFRHNNGMTEMPDKTLLVAEYGNVWDENGWRKLAYLYLSSDEGETWERSDFLIGQGTNKHVHLVRYSRLLDKIFMADGDNKKKLWVADASSTAELRPKWKPINRFHIQMGGYTSIAESGGKMLFGTDYQGGTNFIVQTSDGLNYDKKIVPDPYRRSPVMNMVQRKSHDRNEIWSYLPYSTPKTKSLLMVSLNGGESWNKVLEYNRSTHKVWLISSSIEPANELYFSVEELNKRHRVVFKIDG